MARTITLSVLLALLAPALAGAQEGAKNPGMRIAPLVDEETVAVCYINFEKVNLDHLFKFLGELTGQSDAEVKTAAAKAKDLVAEFRARGVREVFGVFNLAGIPNEPIVIAFPYKDSDTNITKLIGRIEKLAPQQIKTEYVRGFVVAGPPAAVERMQNMKPKANPQIAKAFAGLEKYDVRLVVVLPEKPLRKALLEVAPELPRELGGGSLALLIEDFESLTAGVSLRDPLTAEVVLKASDEKIAGLYLKTIAKASTVLVMAATKGIPDDKVLPAQVKELLAFIRPKQEKDRLVWKVEEKQALQVLTPVAAKIRAAAARMESQNKLRQIVVALHNYHVTHKRLLAAANYSKDGKPLLSWRVHILPYIEEEQLYRQFKLDEPWDSPHNKKLIGKMPAVFRSPDSRAPAGKTTYLAPVGNDTIFGPKPTRFAHIRDGTSRTIILVEADDDKAVFWTKPEDLPVSEKDPFQGLGKRGMFHAAFADGSVRAIAANIDPRTLWAMFTKSGGELLPNE